MSEVTTTPLKGISIRDRFAVEALGFLIQKYESNSIPIPDIVARAYEYASNMLTKANTSGASDTDYNIGKILTDGFAALVEAIGEGGGGTSSFNGKVQNADNTNFRVIGTQSYGEGTAQKTGVLNVAVVAGGGGGGSTDLSGIVNTLQYTDQGTSNVITLVNRINRLLDILGYYPGSPDATLNSTQHKDLKDLISTIANVNGPFMRDDAEEASALVLNNISDLVVFADWDYVGSNRPFRVPISNFDSRIKYLGNGYLDPENMFNQIKGLFIRWIINYYTNNINIDYSYIGNPSYTSHYSKTNSFHVCKVCDKVFIGKSASEYCSSACRQRISRKVNRY